MSSVIHDTLDTSDTSDTSNPQVSEVSEMCHALEKSLWMALGGRGPRELRMSLEGSVGHTSDTSDISDTSNTQVSEVSEVSFSGKLALDGSGGL